MADKETEDGLLIAPKGQRFLSEKEFEDEFLPTHLPSGELFEYEHVKNTPPENVWTIVESGEPDDENWYALPGFHIVNKVGYVTSVFPWTDDIAEAIYFDADELAPPEPEEEDEDD
jgi:hypothetical protein